MVFDMVASRVHGLVQAKDCRIVWADGHLYICKSPTDITVFESSEPKKTGGMWKVKVGEASLSWQKPGCGSCRARVQASPVGQMTIDAIIAAASEMAE